MKIIKSIITITLGLVTLGATAQKINTTKSTINWSGEKVVGGGHNGGITLKSGSLSVKKNKVTKGNFVIDMTSITCADLTDKGYNAKLVGHLKSDDFFGVAKHAEASFVVTSSTAFVNGKASVTGNITIKGKTESITFDVMQSGKTYTATIKVDRSKFDVRYGSKSFFDDLGDKAISNIFTLEVKLVTE